MKKKTASEDTTERAPVCLCAGFGPELSQALRVLGLPDDAREHLRNARIEVLKAVRSVLDRRIDDLSRPASRRGTKVEVE